MNNMKYPESYCVFDFETTGLDPVNDKILEIGALKVTGDKTETYNAIINWGEPVPARITEITGITTELVEKEGKSPDDVRKEFKAFLKGAFPLIGHNIYNFDLKFLSKFFELDETEQKKLGHCFIDTAVEYKARKMGTERQWNESFLKYAKRIMETRSFVKFNLGLACDETSIDRTKVTQHRALGDVELTNSLYRHLFLNLK